jgi:hypothetical protein
MSQLITRDRVSALYSALVARQPRGTRHGTVRQVELRTRATRHPSAPRPQLLTPGLRGPQVDLSGGQTFRQPVAIAVLLSSIIITPLTVSPLLNPRASLQIPSKSQEQG